MKLWRQYWALNQFLVRGFVRNDHGSGKKSKTVLASRGPRDLKSEIM